MIGKTKKILIIGSAPDSVNATKWKNLSFDNIVTINNAWKIRKDWTNSIYPEDFPVNQRPKANEKQTLHSSDEYVEAQNHFGGFVYAGGTMAFTAGYWALFRFKPQIICYTGCDMVYKGEKTHFYGKGTADPLRKDKTLNNLLAKSARLEAIAFINKCKILNLSNIPESKLTFTKVNINDLDNISRINLNKIKEEKINLALQKEKKTGYFVPDGKYWKKMDKFEKKEIKIIDNLWLSSIQQEIEV